MGLSGAGVCAVSTDRGEFVLRVQGDQLDETHWTQGLLVQRRAADGGVAPAIVHVDEAARATVAVRVDGPPIAAVLGDPARRGAALASVVEQLRALHALDGGGLRERDPLPFAREAFARQRVRAGFPGWAAGLGAAFDRIGATLARDPRRVVSHNDVNPGNVLWDGRRARLVDWDVAGLTHPYYDLAAFTTFLGLGDAPALALLAAHDQAPVDERARASFAALRQLAALLCGLTFLGLAPDLGVPTAPARADAMPLQVFYGELRAGTLDLQTAQGQVAFGLALLHLGTAEG